MDFILGHKMKVNFGGVEENVVTRDEVPLPVAKKNLEDEVIAILGYGPQGMGQGLNLRDNGFNVIVGQRESYHRGNEQPTTWERALADGWKPNKTLFSLEEAAGKGTIIAYLVSDAAQHATWPSIKDCLETGNSLYFSHGFGPHFLGIKKPDVDVIMVAPKGAGLSVRRNFLNGSGINASYAVEQDVTGKAFKRAASMGIGIGAGFLFETTARNEVVSDHFGERAFLLGEVWAITEAAYDALREKYKMSGEQAFIGSSEQVTQVILPLIGSGGAAGIYNEAKKHGQLGTILKYQKTIRETTLPFLEILYKSVEAGTEARKAIVANSNPNYRRMLEEELSAINESDMWQIGNRIRTFVTDRTYGLRITNWGLAGAILGAMEAQYQTLINHGHTPSESFNETVEEATQSLNQFYQARGVAHLLGVCSTTAQRGALDWGPEFKKLLLPQFLNLGMYNFEIQDMGQYTNPDMWAVGQKVRELRPENRRR